MNLFRKAFSSRKGFTLVELMVVIVILASLVALGSIAVVQVLRGSENTKRTAFAKTIHSAIMAYKNENGEWPIPDATSYNNSTVTYGTVNSSNRADKGNAEVIMLLYGRDANGRRDETMRAYITDSSALYVVRGNSMQLLDDALASGGVSANDMIGFPITMRKTNVSQYRNLSQAQAFAPIQISFDFDLDHYSVSVPTDMDFGKVVRLH